ncbi:unnamed protein product [Prunus armeniaca]
MSTVSSITLLITLNFKTVDAFEEKVVDLDIEELVKASLESKTSLTNVFPGNKVHEGNDRFVCVELHCGRLMMQSPRSVLNIPSMATTSSASVSLKLLIDTKSHKVLFAEASKEGLKLLKASFESNAVLTNVFLEKKEE